MTDRRRTLDDKAKSESVTPLPEDEDDGELMRGLADNRYSPSIDPGQEPTAPILGTAVPSPPSEAATALEVPSCRTG